jgi:transposase InsO family protein
VKKKRFSVKQIVGVLKQAEVGVPVGEPVRKVGIPEQTFRDECLNTHWFTSLEDARQVIEAWRKEYNESRPHRALGERTLHEFAHQIAASCDLMGLQNQQNSL